MITSGIEAQEISIWMTGLGSAVAMAVDLRYLKIPNLLTMSLCLGGVVHHVIDSGLLGGVFSLSGAVVGFVLLFLPFAIGAFGAGDVKMVAALGAWLGPNATVLLVIFSMIAMVIYSLSLLAWQRRCSAGWACFVSVMRKLRVQLFGFKPDYFAGEPADVLPHRGQYQIATSAIPFSVMIAVGLVATWWIVGTTVN